MLKKLIKFYGIRRGFIYFFFLLLSGCGTMVSGDDEGKIWVYDTSKLPIAPVKTPTTRKPTHVSIVRPVFERARAPRHFLLGKGRLDSSPVLVRGALTMPAVKM